MLLFIGILFAFIACFYWYGSSKNQILLAQTLESARANDLAWIYCSLGLIFLILSDNNHAIFFYIALMIFLLGFMPFIGLWLKEQKQEKKQYDVLLLNINKEKIKQILQVVIQFCNGEAEKYDYLSKTLAALVLGTISCLLFVSILSSLYDWEYSNLAAWIFSFIYPVQFAVTYFFRNGRQAWCYMGIASILLYLLQALL